MGFFQNSVINKHINALDKAVVNTAYAKFKEYFHNPEIQHNIREAKEEQFQEGFLRELFVKILGYTLNPQPNYNLTTELKNEKGAKKADGAILKDGKAVAVIELKGTDTKDLDKINIQAFNYKNNQTGCIYVITSNFEKLRFFIHNSVDHLEFNLFTLTEKEFELLWLCLSVDSLLGDIPLKVKEESLHVEENVTKQLYKDYAAFRIDLWQNMVKNRPDVDQLHLFKKTQKLLDRFLFIFFAEDSGLLPPNSISRIVKRWSVLKEEDAYKPLYNIFNQYFGYINTGRKGKTPQDDIFAYNGGLFFSDEVLDNIVIDDDVLQPHVMKLTGYDFQSEIDVNILGHIFENSLSEIENVIAKLEGKEVDKNKTKRKKEGVFYTPKYITKYIVDNTVGKLCEEKKAELGIVDEEYSKGRRNRKKVIIKKLDKGLQAYRKWLLNITICDPACGSGAFLNQALDFLIAEHTYIDELQAQLLGQSIVFQDVCNHILEKNIYGVDINEESVDIAKLSLWLRTAQKGRKLTTLNNNLKCGNSLIDNPEVAEEKAFKWQKEFPEIFKKGGFDVVIGNPPYLRVQGLRDNFEKETKLYENQYKSATGRFDVYVLFIEKSYGLINDDGKVSFILPHKFMVSDFGEGIRQFLIENKAIENIVHFGAEMVFADASTYTCILCMSKNNNIIKYKQLKPSKVLFSFEFDMVDYKTLDKNKWNLLVGSESKLFKTLYKQPQTVKSVFENISQGVVSVGDDIYLMKGEIKGDKFIGYSDKIGNYITIEAATVKPVLKGEDVKKYAPLKNTYYCFYPHLEIDGKTVPYEEDFFKENYPLAYNYILPFREELIEKKIRYKTNPKAWYSLHRSREISLFEQEKIITPEISLGTNMTIDVNNLYHNTKCYSLAKKNDIKEDNRFWLAILNSKLLWYFLSSTGYVLRGGFFTFKTKYLEPFPLPKLDSLEEQIPFIDRVNLIINKTEDFQNSQMHFIQLLQNKFDIKKLTAKIRNWNELEFKEFIQELNKQKIKFSLSEEANWLKFFNEEKEKTQRLKSEIEEIDKEINQMVYELYGLTKEEIEIIETTK